MSESNTVPRRTIAKYIGLIASGGAAAGLGVTVASRPAFALSEVSFSASDVSKSSNSGKLQSLTVLPSVDYSWDGLDQEPLDLSVTVKATLANDSNGYKTIASETTSLSGGTQGSGSFTFSQSYGLLANTYLEDDDFEPANSGKSATTETTDVDLQLAGTLLNSSGDALYSDTATATYTVSLTNEGAAVSVGGSAGTGGSMAG
jgi:hypothetical protein